VATDKVAAVPPQTVEALIRARLSAAVGGLRGSVETALPTIAFVGVWAWRQDLQQAVGASLVVAVAMLLARLAVRQTPRYVFTSVAATAVAAVFALRSGRADAAFLPGILTNAGLCVAALLSVATRWPLVGFVVAAGDPRVAEDPTAWRRDAGLVRVCQRLTLVLVGLYAVRLVVMTPLYALDANTVLGVDRVALLGVSKLVLGWPAYVAAVAVMTAILVRGHTTATPGEGTAGPQPS
jgi:hypothetical protein